MSFLTGRNAELIYANTAAFTAKNTFTSEVAINDVGATTGPRVYLPKGFFGPGKAEAVGKAIYIYAAGLASTTATPTYQWTIRGGATGSTSSAILLGHAAAITTASGIANVPWYIHGTVALESHADGAAATIRGTGYMVTDGLTVATTTRVLPMWGGAASPGTATTFDPTIDNFINFNVTCSASSASNQVQLLQLFVYGLN